MRTITATLVAIGLMMMTTASRAQVSVASRHLIVDGQSRTYELTRPAARPQAILIALHPRPASGAAMRHISALDTRAEVVGFVLAYPDGIEGGWNADGAGLADDDRFIESLIGHLRTTLNLATAPVYLVGVSNGAAMAERLLNQHPAWFAGAALISGGLEEATSPGTGLLSGPVLVMIGDDDPAVVALTQAALARRARFGCAPERTEDRPDASRTIYRCEGGVLEEWRLKAGHVWPGAVASGPLSWPDATFVAADEVLRVFGFRPAGSLSSGAR